MLHLALCLGGGAALAGGDRAALLAALLLPEAGPRAAPAPCRHLHQAALGGGGHHLVTPSPCPSSLAAPPATPAPVPPGPPGAGSTHLMICYCQQQQSCLGSVDGYMEKAVENRIHSQQVDKEFFLVYGPYYYKDNHFYYYTRKLILLLYLFYYYTRKF